MNAEQYIENEYPMCGRSTPFGKEPRRDDHDDDGANHGDVSNQFLTGLTLPRHTTCGKLTEVRNILLGTVQFPTINDHNCCGHCDDENGDLV